MKTRQTKKTDRFERHVVNIKPCKFSADHLTVYLWGDAKRADNDRIPCWAFMTTKSICSLLGVARSTAFSWFGDWLDESEDISTLYGFTPKQQYIELGDFVREAQKYSYHTHTTKKQFTTLVELVEKAVPADTYEFCIHAAPEVVPVEKEESSQEKPKKPVAKRTFDEANQVDQVAAAVASQLQQSIAQASSALAHEAVMTRYKNSAQFEEDKLALLQKETTQLVAQWVANKMPLYKAKYKDEWKQQYKDEINQELEDYYDEQLNLQLAKLEAEKKKRQAALDKELAAYKEKVELDVALSAIEEREQERQAKRPKMDDRAFLDKLDLDLAKCDALARELMASKKK